MCKRQLLILCAIILLLFTSCFEFVEEISFNKDGSGSATLTLNLSKNKTKIASILLLDSINGYKVPSKKTIQKKIAEVVKKIKKTKGIHNVNSTLNLDEFIVAISCDFDTVDALNSVLIAFSSKKQGQAIKNRKHFTYNKTNKTFVRSHHFNIGREFQNTKLKDRKVFETATYTGIYRFEDLVRSCENKLARISKSKKAVMLRVKAQDIITNNQTIKNKIQLQN